MKKQVELLFFKMIITIFKPLFNSFDGPVLILRNRGSQIFGSFSVPAVFSVIPVYKTVSGLDF